MIIIGSDHGGYRLKEELKRYLDEKEISYKDLGTNSELSVDYPNIAICRSGYGMAMVANKFRGIRSAPCFNEQSAKFSRLHNNTNVLALGADYITTNEAICILRMWLATEFEGGRHSHRLELVEEIEKENMK